MKKFRSIISLILVLAVCAVLLTGCVRTTQLPNPPQNNTSKVNTEKSDSNNNADTPTKDEIVEALENNDKSVLDDKKTEIIRPDDKNDKSNNTPAYIGDDWEVVVKYDTDGFVTEVTAYNDETHKSNAISGYEGKNHDEAVNELIAAIKNEGYFIDDVDRERNHTTIEIDDRNDRDDEYDKYDWD